MPEEPVPCRIGAAEGESRVGAAVPIVTKRAVVEDLWPRDSAIGGQLGSIVTDVGAKPPEHRGKPACAAAARAGDEQLAWRVTGRVVAFR